MRMSNHRTSVAWPLLWVCTVLIVYASLYPFAGWRFQGIAPWAFLASPLPTYWTGFDVMSNLVGYAPFGFLMALALLRSRLRRSSVALATLAAAALSLSMECLQMFMPVRVPSNVDAALNVAGAFAGAVMPIALERVGLLDRWRRFRDHWFEPRASGAIALLVVWPMALLFPVPVNFGLGHVLQQLIAAVAHGLEETPWVEWLLLHEIPLQPLLPFNEALCVAIGLLLPCVLSFSVFRLWHQRIVVALLCVCAGFAVSGLSCALSNGPAHAWDWIGDEVLIGLALAVVGIICMSLCPPRVCWVATLMALAYQLSVLNTTSVDAYFTLTLQAWEQGKFIRFHGLSQWLGWLWPYAMLGYLIYRLSSPSKTERA